MSERVPCEVVRNRPHANHVCEVANREYSGCNSSLTKILGLTSLSVGCRIQHLGSLIYFILKRFIDLILCDILLGTKVRYQYLLTQQLVVDYPLCLLMRIA